MTKINADLPGNSKASRRAAPVRGKTARPRKSPEKTIISETVRTRPVSRASGIVRKPTFIQSIAKSFVGEGVQSVGAYILYDVLIPAAKTTIQDMIISGIDMLLYGEVRSGSKSRSRGDSHGQVSYGNFYKRGGGRPEPKYAHPKTIAMGNRFELDEIYFRYGNEASDVLESMMELLEQYDEVTVTDYYDLAGVDGATWAHNKYGWKDLTKSFCTHTRNGYAIVLPEPMELD